VSPSFDPSIVKAILFDLDGTLADTDDLLVDRLAQRFRRWAFLLPHRDAPAAARRLIMNADSPFNSLYAWVDRLYLDEVWAFAARTIPFRRQTTARIVASAVPGAVSAVSELSRTFAVGVVTTRSARSAAQILQAINLDETFGVVANARSTLRIKPHPAPVRWAARQLSLPVEACVMVGDTGVDMRAGVAAGAQVVGVLCGFGDQEELTRAGAQVVLDSPADLPALFAANPVPVA
jgi:phosphoglycolate phosphatase-like HAD superfamily hydrolase